MSNFAILRFEKLNTVGSVVASGAHMMRARPTSNANPAVSNRVLSGTSDPFGDVNARLADATQRRKNSVLAIEVMASASPEWFEAATKAQKQEWVRSTRAWLSSHFGEKNIAHLQLHLDETTPHLTGFIVPIDPDSGRLNAARWLDGSAKLADMQTAYAKAVEPLGLVRGLEGSDATHTTLKQFHAAMRRDVAQVAAPEVAAPPVMLREAARTDWAAGEGKRIHAQLAPDVATLTAQARSGLTAEKRAKAYQATAERFRASAAAARDVPVQEVAERLGLARDKRDKEKWVDAEGRVALKLTGQQWFDHKAQVGGGGAIDLVRHVLGCGLPQAVSWLGHGVGVERAAAALTAKSMASATQDVKRATEAVAPFQAPARGTPEQQATVRAYLTRDRGLSPDLVDAAMARGLVYADGRANAVFPAMQADGAVGGAELRGTGLVPFHGLASGSTREACFTVEMRGRGPRKLVLVESAIDALSYAQLHPGENLTVGSTSGARPVLPASLAGRLEGVDEVVVAFDDDATGRTMGQKLMAALRELKVKVTAALPSFGKDWNDCLRHVREQQAATVRASTEAATAAREALSRPPATTAAATSRTPR